MTQKVFHDKATLLRFRLHPFAIARSTVTSSLQPATFVRAWDPDYDFGFYRLAIFRIEFTRPGSTDDCQRLGPGHRFHTQLLQRGFQNLQLDTQITSARQWTDCQWQSDLCGIHRAGYGAVGKVRLQN